MDTISPPGKLPAGKGPLVRNFLPGLVGKLTMRGGLQESPYKCVDTTVETKAIITNVWSFNDKILIGFHKKAAASEGYIPPWKAPYAKASEAKKLAASGTNLAWVDLTAGTVTKIAIAAEHLAPGSNGARLEKYVYGFAYDSATSENTNGGFQWLTPLLRWNGAAEKPVAYTKAPKGGKAVKSHLNRLWCLGGTDPTAGETIYLGEGEVFASGGGSGNPVITTPSANISLLGPGDLIRWQTEALSTRTEEVEKVTIEEGPSKPQYVVGTGTAEYGKTEPKRKFYLVIPTLGLEQNTLFYTDQYGPVTDSVEFWKDDVSGLVNRIIVGDDDQNDFGVTLGVVNAALIIFKRHSIWALYGYSRSTFQIRNLTKERGCVDPNSICEVDGGIYFMSQNGLEFFDGSQFHPASDSISNLIQYFADKYSGESATTAPLTTSYGRVTVSYIGNDYLFVTLAGQLVTSGGSAGEADSLVWAGYVHTPTGSWSEFSSNALGSTTKVMSVHSTSAIPFLWDGNFVTPIPSLTESYPNSVLRDEIRSIKKAIPAKALYDRVELSSPGYGSQLHRFMLDYRMSWPEGDPGQLSWWVSALNTDSSVLMAAQQVPGQGAYPYSYLPAVGTSSYPMGKRFEFDDFNEAQDFQLCIEWKSTEGAELSAVPVQAEIYDATIELQTARQRRSL